MPPSKMPALRHSVRFCQSTHSWEYPSVGEWPFPARLWLVPSRPAKSAAPVSPFALRPLSCTFRIIVDGSTRPGRNHFLFQTPPRLGDTGLTDDRPVQVRYAPQASLDSVVEPSANAPRLPGTDAAAQRLPQIHSMRRGRRPNTS